MEDRINEWKVNSLDEEFLRDILQQPQEPTAPVSATVGSLTFDDASHGGGGPAVRLNVQLSSSNSSITFPVSFDNSTSACASLPTIHDDPSSAWKEVLGSQGTDYSPLSSSRANQGTKKNRSAIDTLHHIMSERKRRQNITKKVIALSAVIPGLKKMEKSHVLGEAVNYMKRLQKRVEELEEDIKKSGEESVIAITRSHLCNDEGTTLCETNSNGCCGPSEALPQVEARVLGKDVLIKIYCAKQKDILLKIFSLLESLHLSIASSNVLPFGNTLNITVIAQMGDKHSMIVKDLVENLRLAMLKM